MQRATPLFLAPILAATTAFIPVRSSGETASPPTAPQKETTAAPAHAWPQAASDIPVDPKAVFGKLDNGFRYIIYPNSEPPDRVSLRLHIASGSLMEAEDQRGLAHFLEHMVFNGSKDFSAEELIPKMQRLGIGFGAHVNAFTSFDQTVYMLDLPDLSQETVDLGFTVMRDFGDGALLDQKEIDSERGVILSEKVSRDSVQTRIMEKQFDMLLPKSLVSKRFPIGEEAVISKAARERFADLYSRYYIPQRMTFIVVGDIEAKKMEERIRKTFGSMKNPEKAGTEPDLGPIDQPEGIQAAVFADPEVASTDLSLMLVRPAKNEPDTASERSQELALGLANSIISRRFERISKEENSPVADGSASDSDLFNYMEIGSIDVTAADDRWQDALPVLEREFRRALEYGFTAAELAEAKSNVLNTYQQRVKQKQSRRSDVIASALARIVNDRKVFSDPETDLKLATEALDSLDADKVHAAFADFWKSTGYHLILTTKEKPEGAEAKLAALYDKSRGETVEAPAAREMKPFGYTDFGNPGKVASRKEIEDLGITQLIFENKVRVNLKPTDFEKGRIRLLARIGSGKLTQPADMPMLDDFATAVFEGGGLGKHSNDDLREILAGKNVGTNLAIGEDAFLLSGTTTSADFATEVRLMCANLTDPGYRTEALWQFRKAVPMIYQQLRHTAAGPQQEMQAWLYGNDPRFAPAPEEKLASYTLEDAKKWLTPELTKGYLELSIVGDFQTEKILPDLLATFGALAPRAEKPADLATARKVELPKAPAEKSFTYDSKIPQGVATAYWPADGVRGHQKEFRRLNVLAAIYGDRLREEIREKLGASYSPAAAASGSDALEGVGYVVGQSVGKPEDLDRLLTTMRDLATKFAESGATDDELDRALKPVLSQLRKSLRDNSYWLGTVLSQSQEDPARLELARGRDEDYTSIKLSEIDALAKKYLGADNALLTAIKPKVEPSK